MADSPRSLIEFAGGIISKLAFSLLAPLNQQIQLEAMRGTQVGLVPADRFMFKVRYVFATIAVIAAVLSAAPATGAQTVSLSDITARDQLIFNQESLLNSYRCRFNVDTQIVPGGCPTPGPISLPNPGSASSDRDALVALHQATGGPRWTIDTNWLSDAPLGQWHGVTVDANGRVTGLNPQANQLSGPIPAELGRLTRAVEGLGDAMDELGEQGFFDR